MKVKLEGRRRLCKTVSSSNDCDNDNGTFMNGEPDNLVVADYKSPSPRKGINSADGDGNEIMDILNDLSAKFEVLSMEKRPVSKKTGRAEGFSSSCVNKGAEFYNEKELDKNAGPSFSRRPDPFGDCSGNNFNQPNVYEDESEINGVGSISVNSMTDCAGEKQKNETKHVDSHISLAGRSSNLNLAHRRREHNDDDCVIISNQNFLKNVNSRQSTVKREPGDSGNINILDTAGTTNFASEDSIVMNGPNSKYKLHGRIAKMLYPHQRDGLKWLWSLHCQGKGGILGDDMGLGKTMQVDIINLLPRLYL